MRKKKKALIKPAIKRYIESILLQKIKYCQLWNNTTYMVAYLLNMNSQFNTIIKMMDKNKLIENDHIVPSILNEFNKDITIKPFWNSKIQLLSDKLYLPSFDNLHKSDYIHKAFASDTWFSVENYVNLDRPYFLKTKENNNEINDIIKTNQIKLFLKSNQEKYMKKIIGTYRYYYNRCVSFFNNYDKRTKTSWYLVDPLDMSTKKVVEEINNPYNFVNMRPILKEYSPEWQLEGFPSHLIDKAFKEAFDKFNGCMSNYFKTKRPFIFKYKTKKDIYQTINIESNMISKKHNGFFTMWQINGIPLFKNIRTHDKINKYKFQDSSITYHTVLKTFVLNLTHTIKSKPTKIKNIGAIDQGIRTPFTVYSTSEVVKIGNKATDRISKVCKEIDIIQSRINSKEYYTKDFNGNRTYYTVTSNRKRNLRKAMHKKIQYLKNLKTELHNKSIRYLCDNFDVIIVPPFKTKEMVGNLHSKTARMMCTFGFYQFKTKLINKAKEYNIRIVEKGEPFTSKTCGNCGNLNYNLGSSETYNCPKCNLIIDRDINGSRCILLRNIEYC